MGEKPSDDLVRNVADAIRSKKYLSVEQQLPIETREHVLNYLDDMRKRFWGLAGINIVVVFGFIAGMWAFAKDIAEDRAEATAYVAAERQASNVIKTLDGRIGNIHAALDSVIRDNEARIFKFRSDLQKHTGDAIEYAKVATLDAQKFHEDLAVLAGQRQQLAPLFEEGVAETLGELVRWTLDDKSLLADVDRLGKDLARLEQALEPINALPIGSIIAWHKKPTGKLIPPEGWAECNGPASQDDVFTPFDETTIPNLNGEQRFLRGGTNSGILQDDEFKQHSHYQPRADGRGDGSAAFPLVKHMGNRKPTGYGQMAPPYDRNAKERDPGGKETRPVNMSVVWIIRVK